MSSNPSTSQPSLSLRGKLFALLGLATLGMLLLGFLHQRGQSRLEADLKSIGHGDLPALRAMGTVDMVHDGLRSAVFRAAYAREYGDAAAIAEVYGETADFAKLLSEQLAVLDEVTLSGTGKSDLEAVKPELDRYVRESSRLVDIALKGDLKGYRAALPAFQVQFDALEGTLAKIGDAIQERSNVGVKASEDDASSTLRIFLIAAGILIAGFLSAGFYITRNVLAEESRGKAKETEVRRLLSMIEGSITNFMTCDLDLKITSANPAVIKLLTRYQNDLRKIFPNLDPSNLIGTCIDIFHKHPDHQRRLLKDVRNLPFQTEIKVGDLEFGLNLSALYDSAGNHIGNAVEWVDNNARAAYRKEVDRVLKSMQEGELSVRGKDQAMDKVFQPMLAGINSIIEAVVEPLEEVKAQLAKVSTGDLGAYVTGSYRGDHQMLKNALNGTLDSLNDILSQVATAADQVAGGSRQVSDSSQALSQGATEQASSLEQISASMTQMASQTKQNAENATQANQLAAQSRASAEKGNQLMQDMVKAMADIDDSSQNISKIIKAIDEIAFQTNLLALNAAVEAARAGVHGKGFAVVAEEVRNLAARSAKAAKETTEMIEGSIKKVNMGSEIAKKTADSLVEIVGGVGKVTDLVGEIAAASNEQAQGISQVNQGLTQLDQVTQQNTSSAEQSAAASQELSGQSAQLKQTLTKFRLRDGGGEKGRDPSFSRAPFQAPSHPIPAAPEADWTAHRKPKLGSTIHSNGSKPIIALDDKDFGRY